MTALAANTRLQTRDEHLKTKGKALVKANVRIYQDAMVCLDSATGRAEPASDTAGLVFAGFATREFDNTGGSADAFYVEYEYGHRVRIPKAAAITVADLGAQACVADDATVSDAGAMTNDVKVGRIEEIEGNFAWVSTEKASL